MDYYFCSAEQPVYARILEQLDVRHVALSYYEWERRHSTDALHKHVADDVNVIIMPGVAKKEGIDFKPFVRSYVDFAEANAERPRTLIYDLDAQHCPPVLRNEARKHLSMLAGFVAFPTEDETHFDLAATYERIGVNANAGKSMPASELRRIPGTLFGSNITDPKTLSGGRFEATTSFAWLSARRYGELWLFVKGRLRHFKADQLQRAVRSYRDELEALGVDPERALANDKDALTLAAVRSLQLTAQTLTGRPRDGQRPHVAARSSQEASGDPVASRGTAPATSVALEPLEAPERARILLPVLRQEEQVVRAQGQSLRMCDSCDISDVCPQYQAAAHCAFELPIKISSDTEWEQACQVILEWQFARVAHGVFAEQVNGGTLSAKVGQEMDRFTKLLGSVKDLKKDDPFGSGILSRIMGEAGIVPPPQVPEVNDGDEEEAEDAEVVDEDGVEEQLVDAGLAGREANASGEDRT